MVGNYIVVFDIFALVYFLAIAIAFQFGPNWPSKYSKYFKYLLFIGILGTSLNLFIAHILTFAGTNKDIIYRVSNILYLCCINLFYIYNYRFILLSSRLKNKNKFLDKIHIHSINFLIVLSAIGLFNNKLVDYNNGDIKYGFLFIFLVINIVLFIILTIYILIKSWRTLSRSKKIVYSMLIAMSLMILFIFSFYSHVLISEFLMSIYIAFVFVTVYKEENYKEDLGSIYTRSGFKKMIELYFLHNNIKSNYVFTLTLNEYNVREASFGIEKAKKIRSLVIKKLSKEFPKKVYSIRRNMFTIVSEKDISNDLINLFIDNSYLIEISQDTFITINPTIAKFSIPTDFRSVSEVMYAINSCLNIDDYDTNKIIEISRDLITEKENNIKEETIMRRSIEEKNISTLYMPIISKKDSKYHELLFSIFIGEKSEAVNFNDFNDITHGYGLRKSLEDDAMVILASFIETTNLESLGINRISITFGISEFNTKGRSEELINIFKSQTNKDPSILSFQFLENKSYINEDSVKNNINFLRELGITCILSDYGSGYSTLNYINRFPFDGIKINRRITRHVDDESKVYMLEYLVNVSKDLNKTIILDGVDNPKIMKKVENLEVDFISGRLFGEYLNDVDIVKFIKEKK